MDSNFSTANKRDLTDNIVASLFGTFCSLALFYRLSRRSPGDDEEEKEAKFKFYANDVYEDRKKEGEFLSIQNYDTSLWPHQILSSPRHENKI